MAIQVANFTAQIGADVTQFRMGMAEVDARLQQAASRAVTAANQVDIMRRKAVEAANDAQALYTRSATATTPAGAASLRDRGARMGQRGLDLAANADDRERDAAAAERVAQTYANRLSENAREHQVRAFNTTGRVAQDLGVMVIGALGAATATGADYNLMMTKAAHNTSLTSDGVKVMRSEVARLGEESGADLQQLAEGFRRVENFSFGAADSAKITEIAMRSAVGAGADMATTSELLAKSLVQFNYGADKANNVMNTMHVAANLSSLELQQLVEIGGQTYSMASNMGVGFVEANAALVTFTKQGLNAREAMTQFRNDLSKLASPTEKTLKYLDAIKQKSGVDLKKVFTTTGLRENGLAGAFSKVREAAEKSGSDPRDMAATLFPNMRGTIGAMIMSSNNGFNQFEQTVSKLNEAFAGKIDPTTKQYAETLGELGQQAKRVQNVFALSSAQISEELAPNIVGITDKIILLVKGFNSLSPSTKSSMINGIAWGGAVLVFTGLAVKAVVGLLALNTAFIANMEAAALSQAAVAANGVTVSATTVAWRTFGTVLLASWPAILGWTAAIAAAAVVIYQVTKALDTSSHALTRVNEEVIKNAGEQDNAAQSALEYGDRTRALVKEYENLTKAGPATREQLSRKRDIMQELNLLSPTLVDHFSKEAGGLGLVKDAAKKAADEYAKLNQYRKEAASNKIVANIAPKSDEAGNVRTLYSALKDDNAKAYQDAFNDYYADGYKGLLGIYTDQGNAMQKFGFKDPRKMTTELRREDEHSSDFFGYDKVTKIATGFDPRYRTEMMKKAELYLAEYEKTFSQTWKDSMIARGKRKPDLIAKKDIVPEGGGVDWLKNWDFGKKKADKDPLDKWRSEIIKLEESIFKLQHTEASADAQWMRAQPHLEIRVQGIKKISEAYKVAAGLAKQYDLMKQGADTKKAFDRLMQDEAAKEMSPKSNRLGDIARQMIGDPKKDRWDMTVAAPDKYAPSGPRPIIMTPISLTGADPELKKLRPWEKSKLIEKADAAQLRKDLELLEKQADKTLDTIFRPVDRQDSAFDKTARTIKEQPELYRKLGEGGMLFWGMVSQAADNAANAAEKAKRAAKDAWEQFEKLWNSSASKRDEAMAEARKPLGAVFGEADSDDTYRQAAAFDMFKTSLQELHPFLIGFAYAVGDANKTIADRTAVHDYTNSIAELRSQFDSLTMRGGGEFQKWLMLNTGNTEKAIESMGKYRGLTLEMWRNLFNAQIDADQAQSLDQLVKSMEQSRRELGLVRDNTTEARIAWQFFGTSVDKLSPKIRADIASLVPEFEKLDKLRKAERIWKQAAETIKGSFANAFEATLSGQGKFLDTFANAFKNAVIRIVSDEAATAVTDFIMGVIHPKKKDKKGEGKEGDKGGASAARAGEEQKAALASAGILLQLSNASPMHVKVSNVSDIGSMMANLMPGGGMPGLPGMGGQGGGIGGGIGGSLISMLGPWGQGAVAIDKLLFGGKGASWLSDTIGNLFGGFFAEGGRPPVGKRSVVNEESANGAEMFVPNSHGMIYPGDVTARIVANAEAKIGENRGGRGGQIVYLTEQFNYDRPVLNDAADVKRVRSVARANTELKLRMIR